MVHGGERDRLATELYELAVLVGLKGGLGARWTCEILRRRTFLTASDDDRALKGHNVL
ncbi:Beta-1,3-galactosyltransferase 5 [Anopheles sinensis]|uniref:Beta-1,3-galactosyltransferase 5 n=1 Tax=Anopheles sinensis TaxID=74873 RepID=A0A084WRI2_ANOSI|nr:Beta-1,3-galactosyltransferase 5 [Anopheles sinensis]